MDPLEGSVHRRCPDITFLKSIGYTPKTPLHHGLTKSYEWYVNYFRNKIL